MKFVHGSAQTNVLQHLNNIKEFEQKKTKKNIDIHIKQIEEIIKLLQYAKEKSTASQNKIILYGVSRSDHIL